MTRLAIVKAERDAEKARADRYWLALSDILAESPRVSPAERFTVDGQRFTLLAINRAMPLIVVTSKTDGASSTEVHDLDTYAAECRDWLYTSAVKVPMITAIGRLHAWISRSSGRVLLEPD